MLSRLMRTSAPPSTILIRILVGSVFLCEGILKYMLPAALGAGRFAKIGIPWPDVMGPFVGGIEIVAGTLVIIGLLTRPAAFLLFVNITVALISTKIPILLGQAYWIFSLPEMKTYGFWPMAHESRTDFCMWIGSLFLMIVGAGMLSFDARLAKTKR
jgi:putative oxidoreductase